MPAHHQRPAVDFVINVFERTYRTVLQPGAVEARTLCHQFPFARRVVLVNNVNDRLDVERLLAPMLLTGEITEFLYVSDLLEDTLYRAGLKRSDIARTIHYTDCSLVAVFLTGSPYLVYSDADVYLQKPTDWISPSLELMRSDERIAIANPDWMPSCSADEVRELRGDFKIGYGFSDQLYLLRREEFARPIYRFHSPISLRFPLAHIGPIFEQMVDSYARCCGRLRATCTSAIYVHDSEEGTTYPRPSFADWLKRFRVRLTVRLCQWLPGRNPRYSR